jgi:hypothetical protein
MIAAETFARTILVTINRVVFVEMFDNVNDYTALIKEGTIIFTANMSLTLNMRRISRCFLGFKGLMNNLMSN